MTARVSHDRAGQPEASVSEPRIQLRLLVRDGGVVGLLRLDALTTDWIELRVRAETPERATLSLGVYLDAIDVERLMYGRVTREQIVSALVEASAALEAEIERRRVA